MSTPLAPRAWPLLGLLLLAGCASSHWDGRVQQHGSVREAMHGDGRGRVDLVVAARPGRWGLGLLEGAAGEVLVADGYVWIGHGQSPQHARTTAGFPRRARAAWLALARVPRWREHPLPESLDLAGLADLVARLAAEEGWDTSRPVPFTLSGSLSDVELRVARGASTDSGAVDPAAAPFSARFAAANGTLVGVYAPDSGGELVHPGETLHVHALLRQPSTLAAHLDAAWVLPGAVLCVPRRR